MLKATSIFKKLFLMTIAMGMVLAAFPATSFAAPLRADPTPRAPRDINGRLERIFARQQQQVEHQAQFLDRVDDLASRIQNLIDKAKEKGLDTSAVQAALDAFKAGLPAAQTAHQKVADLIAAHTGFDGQGKVIDSGQALDTVQAISQSNNDFREAILEPGKALRDAIRNFRQANPPPTKQPDR
jgi:septal ring factor EnvC (AmiA/AmiB activator)